MRRAIGESFRDDRCHHDEEEEQRWFLLALFPFFYLRSLYSREAQPKNDKNMEKHDYIFNYKYVIKNSFSFLSNLIL